MAHTRKKMFYAPKAFNGYGPPEPPIPAAQDRPGRYPCPCCGQITLPVPPEEAVAYICPVCWWENDVFISSDNEPSDENHGLTPDEAVRAAGEISSSGMRASLQLEAECFPPLAGGLLLLRRRPGLRVAPLGHLNRNPPILALFGVFWFPLWWSVSRIPGESAFSQIPPGQAGIVRMGAGLLRRPGYVVWVTECCS